MKEKKLYGVFRSLTPFHTSETELDSRYYNLSVEGITKKGKRLKLEKDDVAIDFEFDYEGHQVTLVMQVFNRKLWRKIRKGDKKDIHIMIGTQMKARQ